MSAETCRSCRFFRLVEATAESNWPTGMCRRYPPQRAALSPEEMGPEELEPDEKPLPAHVEDLMSWRFPLIGDDEWCGEFRARDRDCNITLHGAPAGTTVTHDEQTRTVNIALASALHEVVNAIAIHKGPVWNAIRRHQK